VDLVSAFSEQSGACAGLGSPMYAELLSRCADALATGAPEAEPLRAVLAGHEDDPGPSALALRLLGSVHRLVLDRRGGALATYYPSVGGTWEPDGGWSAFLTLLAERPVDVRAWLDRPPQTNEVGRATALLGGLLQVRDRVGDLPVRLVEIGSSAGLNLRADHYAYRDDEGRRFGPDDATLVIEGAWRGRRLEPWPTLQVVERAGSDVMPVDVTTTEGRLALTAYVWPDQQARLERLRAALRVADAVPADVRRAGAAEVVEAMTLVPGTVTVLWHSVMWQYLSAEEQARVLGRLAALGAGATADAPLAHLRAEPSRRVPGGDHEFLVRLTTWPGGTEEILGTTVGHGVPTTWERPGLP
jgi:hypothetical protein